MASALFASALASGARAKEALGNGVRGEPADASASAPAGTWVTAGRAPDDGRDPGAAKALALEDALRRAVGQAAAQLLGPQNMGLTTNDLTKRILPRAHDYVMTYRYVAASHEGGNLSVTVEAQLDLPKLARDLSSLETESASSAPASRPSGGAVPLLLLVEQEVGPAPATPVVEGADGAAVAGMRDELAGLGFAVQTASTIEPDPGLAAQARAAGARAALVGSFVLGGPERIRGTDLVGVSGGARIHGLDSIGAALGSDVALPVAGFGPSYPEAVRSALRSGGAAAVDAIAGVLSARRTTQDSGGVVVTAMGVASYRDLQDLERALASVPGVRSATPRRFSNGAWELLASTDRSPADVRDALLRTRIPDVTLDVAPPVDDGSVVQVRMSRSLAAPGAE